MKRWTHCVNTRLQRKAASVSADAGAFANASAEAVTARKAVSILIDYLRSHDPRQA